MLQGIGRCAADLCVQRWGSLARVRAGKGAVARKECSGNSSGLIAPAAMRVCVQLITCGDAARKTRNGALLMLHRRNHVDALPV